MKTIEMRAISSNHEIMGGVWCFKKTRIPVSIVIYWLGRGMAIEEIIEKRYPGLTKKKILDAIIDVSRIIAGVVGTGK